MTIVKVENLSKRYILSHLTKKHDSIREIIMSKARAIGDVLTGKSKKLIQEGEEEFWALKDLSLDIKEGERVGIIGRNGAGKSTFLKVISRIIDPTSGRITIKGRVASLLEVGVGFHPELTGRENIFLNGAILGMKKAEIQRKFDEIVAFSEIEKFLDTPVKRYSSGMYVRLAFAVAAHLEPDIMIVDEVLAVGDANFQKKCLGKMDEVSKEGRTILFVSHNMPAVKAICSRAVLLESGKIAYDGDVMTAISKYNNREVQECAIVKWNEESAPSLSSVKLLELGILENGQNVGSELSTEQPIQIYLRYKVFKNNVKTGAKIILDNSEGQRLFATISNHEKEWHNKLRPVGIYKSICEIPPNLLSEGHYSISATMWEGNYEKGLLERNVIEINLHEKGFVKGDINYEVLPQLINPLLTWKCMKEE